MGILSRFDTHERLVCRMYDALGLDLETEMLAGRLAPTEFRNQIFRCIGCHRADACARWLDTRTGVARATPDYCRNRDDLAFRLV